MAKLKLSDRNDLVVLLTGGVMSDGTVIDSRVANRAVGKAMVRLYKGQTESEKRQNTTVKLNGIGFNAFSARKGSYYARWVLSGKDLSGRHLERARRIALKHTRQLLAYAQGQS